MAGLQVQADAVVEGEALAAGVGNCVAAPGSSAACSPSGSTSATATKTPLGLSAGP